MTGRIPAGRSRTQGARPPRIGLALGGGGARGLGHILMLEVFEELGVRPHVIAGTSIGAIYGAAFASGLTARFIRAHTEEVLGQRFDLVRQLFSARADPIGRWLSVFQLRSALFNPETLLDLVLPPRVAASFSDLAIPLRILATDVQTQDQVVIADGALRSAVAASMALPAIFAPVRREGRILLDGGLVNPLPFDVIGSDVDVVVAIDVSGMSKPPEDDAAPSAFAALIASWQIPQKAIVTEKLKSVKPDVLIEVDVGGFNALDFLSFKKILAASEPAKARLRHQLQRVLGSETIAPPAEPAAIAAPEPRPAIAPPDERR